LILHLICLAALAEEPPEVLLIRADESFAEERYVEAADLYGQLATQAPSGDVLYNLGNAHLRAGALGEAIGAYRRAEAFIPNDADLKANLAFAREAAIDAVIPPGPTPVQRTLLFWHHSIGRPARWGWLLAGNLVLWTALVVARTRASEVARWAAVLGLLVALLFGGSLAFDVLAPRRVAVVTATEVVARAADDHNAVERFVLHAGSEVRSLDARDGWVRVALPGGEGGWVPADSVAVVGR
jgi:hypothetical protein